MDAASAAVYASTASEGSITIAAASAASNASVLPAGLQKFKVKNGFYDGPDNPDDEPKDLRRIQSAPTKPVKDDAPVTRNSVHDLHEELKAQKAAQGNVKALSAGEQKEMREFFQKGHSKEDTFNYFTDGTGLDATSVRAFLDEVYSAKDTLIEAACVDGTASGQVAETGCEADAASTHAELTQQELLSQSPEPNVTAKAATPRADPTSLAELKVMRLKSLKEKAIEMGCDQKTVGDVDEEVDPKQAAIDLILKMNAVAHEAVQLAELRGMSLKGLKQKAIELGYEKEAVEDADADENPQQAVIDLILKAKAKRFEAAGMEVVVEKTFIGIKEKNAAHDLRRVQTDPGTQSIHMQYPGDSTAPSSMPTETVPGTVEPVEHLEGYFAANPQATGKGPSIGKADKGSTGKSNKINGKATSTARAHGTTTNADPQLAIGGKGTGGDNHPPYDPYLATVKNDPYMEKTRQILAQNNMWYQMYTNAAYAQQMQMPPNPAFELQYGAPIAQVPGQTAADSRPRKPKGEKLPGTYTGSLMFIDPTSGYGFFENSVIKDKYNWDVFVSKTNLPEGSQLKDRFQFKVVVNDKGQPQASNPRKL